MLQKYDLSQLKIPFESKLINGNKVLIKGGTRSLCCRSFQGSGWGSWNW